MIRLAIVEDNPFLTAAIREKLGFFEDLEVVFTAPNGLVCLEQLQKHTDLNLVLMDIEMPKLNGIETTREVKRQYPHLKVIMLTVFDNDENIFAAIQAGANGYLLKEVSPPDLYRGICETVAGGAAMTPSIASRTLRLLRNPIDFADIREQEQVKLSDRETEVLELLSTGKNYRQIAASLFLSSGTVRKHIENIYKKLQVHSKLEAVEKGRRFNLI